MKMKRLPCVTYKTQRNNKWYKRSACYNTSMAISMQDCLDSIGMTPQDIGCGEDQQLEDYLYVVSQSDAMQKWMKQAASRYGRWLLKYLKAVRMVAVAEDEIFNRLMNKHGFKSTFYENMPWETFKRKLEYPSVVRGKFPILLGGGHMCCCIGYREESNGDDIIIVHDPFGNALKKYKDHDGNTMEYPAKKWFVKKKRIFTNLIERL